MLWINFLHCYQPANSDAHVIEEATVKSYERIVRALEDNPKIKFTMNISGCLFLRWEELGYFDLIDRLRKMVEKKQLEITGTAAYHPALPLVSDKEAELQIKENEKILKSHLGENFKPRGFFMPEMMYGKDVARIIKKMGYEWIILDEIAKTGNLNKVDFDKVYQDKFSKLKVIFRNRKLSKSYVPETILRLLDNKKEDTAITATDGELYGLRHEDPTREFEKLLKRDDLKTLTVSEFVDQKKEVEKIKSLACSWESTEEELIQKKPYALWYDKKNKIQTKLWELANLAYKTSEKYKNDESYHWSRWHLVRGLASCTFWWASAKDFRLFGPISWSPDEIERGANELIRSIRALDDIATRKTKIKAEKIYIKIKKMVWEKHWAYYWKK